MCHQQKLKALYIWRLIKLICIWWQKWIFRIYYKNLLRITLLRSQWPLSSPIFFSCFLSLILGSKPKYKVACCGLGWYQNWYSDYRSARGALKNSLLRLPKDTSALAELLLNFKPVRLIAEFRVLSYPWLLEIRREDTTGENHTSILLGTFSHPVSWRTDSAVLTLSFVRYLMPLTFFYFVLACTCTHTHACMMWGRAHAIAHMEVRGQLCRVHSSHGF